MASIIHALQTTNTSCLATGQAYEAYLSFCGKINLRPLSNRAFADIIAELDIYSLIRTRIISKGRYGRTREIILDMPESMIDRINEMLIDTLIR